MNYMSDRAEGYLKCSVYPDESNYIKVACSKMCEAVPEIFIRKRSCLEKQ